MRILFVEDDEPLLIELGRRTTARIGALQATTCTNAATADAAIHAQTFDAAVIDLRIPSAAGLADAAPEIGLAVESHLAEHQPGTLRVFLTASGAESVLRSIQEGERGDFFETNAPFHLVHHVKKDSVKSLEQCVDLLAIHAERLSDLDTVSLEGADYLDIDDRRVLQLAVRIMGGIAGQVTSQGGLSGCMTALVESTDGASNIVGRAFCKAGPIATIDREVIGHAAAVHRLASTDLPMLTRQLRVGIGPRGGLVFTNAPASRTFFSVVEDDPMLAARVVGRLPSVLRPWLSDAVREAKALAQLRAQWVSASTERDFGSELDACGLHDLGHVELDVLTHCQHGDLHGANLFVTDDERPFLIDFAQTGPASGPADPVSLELSMLFHPASAMTNSVTDDIARHWCEPDTARALRVGPVIEACRSWASEVGYSQTEWAALVALYGAWVIHHTPHKARALALTQGAIEHLKTLL